MVAHRHPEERRRGAPPPAHAHADWHRAPLDQLCRHIVDHHHERTRDLLTRAQHILGEMVAGYPDRPELGELKAMFEILEDDLVRHMLVEEMVLFPYVDRLVATAAGRPVEDAPPTHAEGSVNVARNDHENATVLLAGIRRLADQLAARGDEDMTRMLEALAQLEGDLDAHSGLEDNVLFPRLRELEELIEAAERPSRDTTGR